MSLFTSAPSSSNGLTGNARWDFLFSGSPCSFIRCFVLSRSSFLNSYSDVAFWRSNRNSRSAKRVENVLPVSKAVFVLFCKIINSTKIYIQLSGRNSLQLSLNTVFKHYIHYFDALEGVSVLRVIFNESAPCPSLYNRDRISI